VVFDIDESALSNRPSIKAHDFAWITGGYREISDEAAVSRPCGRAARIQRGKAEAIKPVLAVYRTAHGMGADVFFITGRPDTPVFHAATKKNLRAAGFTERAGAAPQARRATTEPRRVQEWRAQANRKRGLDDRCVDR
jgi:acid phosphatase